MRPVVLQWPSFRRTDRKPRDVYNIERLAVTTCDFRVVTNGRGTRIPGIVEVQGGFVYAQDWSIVVRPIAQIWKHAERTSALLAHEEWHYQSGFVHARAFVNEIVTLRANRRSELGEAHFTSILSNHLRTRYDTLNEDYDTATNHGANAAVQINWRSLMARCMADQNATHLNGSPL